MNKFSQADGIEDNLIDTVGVLAKKIRTAQCRNQVYLDLKSQLQKEVKTKKYLVFTANVTNYGTWTIGQSRLLYVPVGRRGALSIFQKKIIRLICIGSGRFTRLLAAASIKLEPQIHSKVIAKFELNQESLNHKKNKNESYLKKYLRELGIRGSNRSDEMTFIAAKETSSLSSTWTDILALEKLGDDNFQLHQGRLENIGSIYDIEKKIYDEMGNLKIPKSYGGKRIVGLSDGEYLLTNNFIIETSSKNFTQGDHKTYGPFLVEHNWINTNILRKIP